MDSLESLKKELLFYKKLLQHIPGNVFWKGLDNKYIGCNLNVAKILKLDSPEAIKGKTTVEVMGPDSAKAVDIIDTAVLEQNIPVSSEEEGKDIKGNPAIYLTSKYPLTDDEGKIIGMVGISLDITLRKNAEQELQKAKEAAEAASEAKAKLIALLGDELRTPLTTILAQAQTLDNIISLGRKREHAQSIIEEAGALHRLVEDIIDFSSGYAEPYRRHMPVLFDLKKFLEDMLSMHQMRAKKKDIYLILDYPDGLPHWIHSDKFAWRKFISYLLAHVIQASLRQEVIVKIENLKHDSLLKFDIVIRSQGELLMQEDQAPTETNSKKVVSADIVNNIPELIGVEIIEQLVDQIGGALRIEYDTEKGLNAICSVEVPFNKTPAITNNAWSSYQDCVKVLIIDNGTRGQVVKQHLGSDNIDLVGNDDELFTILRAAIALNKPYRILIIGGLHRGAMQEKVVLRIAKEIRQEKDLIQPMLVLLTTNNKVEHRLACSDAGYSLLLNPSIPPTQLQAEMVAGWEKWKEENQID